MVGHYENLRETDPEIFEAIENEINRQNTLLQLIASENHSSLAVREAMSSIMSDKYAEGSPHKRYYGGCEFVDVAEDLAVERAKKLFDCEHVNVQPHAGTQANMAVYFAVMEPGDTLLGMDLTHGGHLSHGHPASFSGKLYQNEFYGVSRDTEQIDYSELSAKAREVKPKVIVCGASAYPRTIDFKAFREIADEVGAILMADIAHIAGLVAAKVHPTPVPYADFVTTTTHKTLRGPRGAMVMCKEEHAKALDKSVFPGIQGGPFMHAIAAKAVCFKEALTPKWREYQQQIVKNAKVISNTLIEKGFRIVSGGTDNHLMLVDLRDKGLNGKQGESALSKAGIVLNKNTIPFDPEKTFVTSGIRIGTPCVTSRGMKEGEMQLIAEYVETTLKNPEDEKILAETRSRVNELCKRFPVH